MLTAESLNYILGTISLGSVAFTVWSKVKTPQIDGDKTAALLAQQVKAQNESTAQRFKDMQDSFNGLLLQSNNHIHTVQTQVETLNVTVSSVGKDLVRLTTIIEERIPKK